MSDHNLKLWTYEERDKFVDMLIANKSIRETRLNLGALISQFRRCSRV